MVSFLFWLFFELVNDIVLRYHNMGWNERRIEGDIMENSFVESILNIFDRGEVLNLSKFSIVNNVLEFYDTIIQISSVTSVFIGQPRKKEIPNYLSYGILLGIVLLFFQPVVGLAILGVCIYFFYSISEKNKRLGKNIVFELNSGRYFIINVKDHEFAKKVVNVLRDCMNGSTKSLTINFDNMNIMDSNVIIGNENQVESNTYENCK